MRSDRLPGNLAAAGPGSRNASAWKKRRNKKPKTTVDIPTKPANFREIRKWIYLISMVGMLAQLAISQTPENVFAAMVCAGGNSFVAFSFFRPKNLKNFPLSSWMVLLFALSNFTVPLLMKTAEFEPLDYNLKFPYLTFGYALATQLALIAGHWLYSNSQTVTRLRNRITYKVLQPLGMFKTPNEFQMWIMGFIGTAAHAVVISRPDLNEAGSPLVKACNALIPFTYAPFLMPFAFLVSDKIDKPAKSSKLIPLYFAFTVVIALAANGRGGLIIPLVTLLMCWMLGYFSNRLPSSFRQKRLVVITALAVAILMPIISNIALAMAVARHERTTSSPVQLIQQTIKDYGDTKAINQVILDAQSDSTWDETYVHNPLLARFVNTKYHDNGFNDTHSLNGGDRDEYVAFLKQKSVDLLPAPVILQLGMKSDKNDQAGSGADFLHRLNTGAALGGFRTGSIVASGVFLYGIFYLPVVGIASIFMFLAADSFCAIRRRRSVQPGVEGSTEQIRFIVVFSPAILLMVWQCVYNNFEFEAVTDWIGVLFRIMPVQVLFYFVIIKLTSLVSFQSSFADTSLKKPVGVA